MKVKSESEVAQLCLTLRDPHGLQPTRLLRPWDFPGRSTGVGPLPSPLVAPTCLETQPILFGDHSSGPYRVLCYSHNILVIL